MTFINRDDECETGRQLEPQKCCRRIPNFDHPWQLYCHILFTLCRYFLQRCCVRFPVVMEQKEAARVCVMFWTVLCLLHSKNTTLLRRHKAWCVYMASRDVGNRAAAHGGEQPVKVLSCGAHAPVKSCKTLQRSGWGWSDNFIANFFRLSRGFCVGEIWTTKQPFVFDTKIAGL